MITSIKYVAALAAAIFVGPVSAQTVEYMHTDALGSVVAITDSSGAVVERNQFEPYGDDLTGIKDGPGFTGHVSDAATGLSYMQQRYYDPQIGRFLSVDPVTADGASGGNFNRYWYGNNNPYLFTDPDGRQSREFNWENRRLGIKPPGRSDKDWLGRPLGYALGGVLAAPAAGYALTTAYGHGAGLFAADLAMGDALGGASLATGTTLLYRVVDQAELADIMKTGHFSPSPNGDEVKRFLDNLPDAEALQKRFVDFWGGEQTIVEGAAPKEVMESVTRTPFSDVPGRAMESVNVPSSKVQKVSCTGTNIKQVSC